MHIVGNPDPLMGERNPEYACDWGSGNKCVFYDGEHILTDTPKTVADFIRHRSPCILYVESPFESYDNQRYNDTLRLANELGTKIFTISPRKTDRLRRDKGLDKSDEVDATLIWEIAHSGYHLKIPQPRDIRRVSRLAKANNDRRAFGYTNANPSWAEAKQYLPPFESLEPWLQDILGNNGKYAEGFVTPIIQAALQNLDDGGNRDDFDKMLGTYAHGYPSYQRAAIYNKANGRVATLVRRDVKSGADEKESLSNRLRQVRSGTRVIYYWVSSRYVGKLNPSTGKVHPGTLPA